MLSFKNKQKMFVKNVAFLLVVFFTTQFWKVVHAKEFCLILKISKINGQ